MDSFQGCILNLKYGMRLAHIQIGINDQIMQIFPATLHKVPC